jgi:Sulfotransferase domain
MQAVRDFVYAKGSKALFEFRRMQPVSRAMPHFLVIGAQKSGTSSMFSYLKQHPQIIRPIFKEPYFFDRHYDRGLGWYGSNFPSHGAINRLNDRFGRPHLTFEATATYIFDEHVPARVARDIKARKFILLLRNPTERVISAYWHARRMGIETRSLADAVEADLRRYREDVSGEAGNGLSPKNSRPNYLRRGIYHEAVARWQSVFSADDLLVLQSEAMFENPSAVMTQVFQFLDLPQPDQIDFEPQNVGGYNDRDAAVRDMLHDFYRPYNEKLNDISRTRLNW